MDLARLLALVNNDSASTGQRAIAAWLATGPPLPARAPAPTADDALLLLLARQLACDVTGAARLHVACADAAALAWLARVSIPGTIAQAKARLLNGHGTCSVLDGPPPDAVKLVTACFYVASSPRARTLAAPDVSPHMRWMQALGAGLHVALGRGLLKLSMDAAERCVDALAEHYAGLGAPQPEGLGDVLVLARELCLWRAGERVLRGGTVAELCCGKDEVAWAARQLVHFPAGDVARQVAAAVRYPDQPRFHTVYHDLVEDVDYNYLSVPLRAVKDVDLAALRTLAPVSVFVYDARGVLGSVKRTLPVTQDLHTSFPARILVLRPFVDSMLARRDMVDAALTCSAS